MGDKKQADEVASAQLMAMFGETIESAEQITKENEAKKEAEKITPKDKKSPE